GELDARERRGDFLLALRLAHAHEPRGVAEIFCCGEIIVEADRIRQIADPPFDRERLALRIVPEHPRLAFGEIGQAEQHQAGGGLAGAVGAEQPENLAARALEAHVVDGRGAVVSLRELVRLDDVFAHRRPNLATAPTSTKSAIAMMPTPAAPHTVEVASVMRNWPEALSPPPREEARRLAT